MTVSRGRYCSTAVSSAELCCTALQERLAADHGAAGACGLTTAEPAAATLM